MTFPRFMAILVLPTTASESKLVDRLSREYQRQQLHSPRTLAQLAQLQARLGLALVQPLGQQQLRRARELQQVTLRLVQVQKPGQDCTLT
jgi:hypothetical protein